MSLRTVLVVAVLAICSLAVSAQTAPFSGTVVDPTGAAVPGAEITLKNEATGVSFKSVTRENGVFVIPAMGSGTYELTVSARGFRQARMHEIKMDVGVPVNVDVKLEIGSQTETVTVMGEGTILQTQTAAVNTTLTGRQIVDLPMVSRDALDLVLFLPNVNTPGRPRSSTVDGLPKGAINITIDGINVQDNLLKSTDGYFTYIRPRLDAIQEVTVSTASGGA